MTKIMTNLHTKLDHLAAAKARTNEAEKAFANQDWNRAAVGYTLAKEQYQHLQDKANVDIALSLAVKCIRLRDGKL